jgi:signal transduction histidine kinase
MINRSIFRRLLFSHISIILLGLATVGLVTSYLVKGFMYDSRRQQMVRQAHQVNQALLDTPPDRGRSAVDTLAFLDKAFDGRLWLFDTKGKIIATSAEADVYVNKSVADGVVQKVLAGQDVVEPLVFPGLPEPMISVVVPLGKGDQITGGLILHAPVQGLNQTVGQVRETILWATLLAVILSTVAGSYLSWSISRPLKEIERVAAEIGNGRYDQQVAVRSADEVGDLAVAINRMAAELSLIDRERESLSTAREELFANISHELRTPLTAILGFLEALQDGFAESAEQQQLYLAVTYREALHLQRLVEDLLDLTRLTSGRVAMQPMAVNVVALAEEVVQQLSPVARARGNELRVEPPAVALPMIAADPVRLRQVLTNLVENSIKFTDRGTITMRMAADANELSIQVADTGIGIAEGELPLIWDRFYKADRVRPRNRGGTGLGLAIVRELVALHGGKIEAESQVGRGTTFTLRLPIAQAA